MKKLLVSQILALIFSANALAKANNSAIDITGTSLSELFNLKITSLSKKKQALNKAAAAVYVLTHDEIDRLGVTTIADALRYVPGVEVANIDASRWAISIRGFNGLAANKLLVMIDGRSIYSPLFSGVVWAEKDVVLADVDRIEVIRGPGGAIWGANAVNGVINIITRKAQATQGVLLEAGVDFKQNKVVTARYGWQLAQNAYMRIYAKHRQHDSTNEQFSNDNNRHNQVGFRFDYDIANDNALTLQGDLYSGVIGNVASQAAPDGQTQSGGNLLVNWQFTGDDNGQHKLLSYYEQTQLSVPMLDDQREIWNVDYQVEQQWQQHALVGGVGYRSLQDQVDTRPFDFIAPKSRHDEVINAFIQDDIALLDDDLHLIVGIKYEHNDYSANEWLPSVRLSYQLPDAMIWAAWSKAVRVPTRVESDIRYGSFSGEHLASERANVYELGWRKKWFDVWQLDATAYRSQYENLLSFEANGYRNKVSGKVQGIELSNSIQLQPSWLVRVNLSHATMDLSTASDSLSPAGAKTTQGQMPRNTAQVISMWDINKQWKFNGYLRYVDKLTSNNIDSYWTIDATLQWQVTQRFSIQLAARNIGDGSHQEWDALVPIEQQVMINFRWGI
ncbi:TonB-dependent receptor plug domain-containing protein [Colwellia sp. C1TZA3]|uniref:TonB-dependent receptor plug domain-containing protein n=1 Tax=Colwellia sp. C1TZA3 TaxID=2508879 RepID=UPI0011B957C2|nr:TonB-dependent receptor [Colwellia sp. C1TZA3]TWX72608.1 TonB-dependent receptor [Colwellia sp. C1TZA3]